MKTRSVQSCALLCVKHTLQKKETCLQRVSLYSTGSYPGHWVIRVIGTDPVSTLVLMFMSLIVCLASSTLNCKAVWASLIDETLHVVQEDTNEHNKYAITITMYCYNSICYVVPRSSGHDKG